MYLMLGLIIGSFLNVVIYRLPHGRSIVTPRSLCAACGQALSAWELVPVVSFFVQRGRCRQCRVRLSWRYPAVEALTAGVFWLLGRRFSLGGVLVPYLVLGALLIAISFIDLDHYYIPDKLLGVGAAAWLGVRLLVPFIELDRALLGASLAFAVMLIIYLLARGGMGFGDVKLAALLGLYLGPAPVMLTLLLSFIVGAMAGIFLMALKLKGRKDMLPLGPFIALGAFCTILFGPAIILWYTAIMGL